MTTHEKTDRVARPLAEAELDTILAGISNATDTAGLLAHTLTSLYQGLLAGTGRDWADVGGGHQLDPTAYAIPTSQWQALVGAAVNRAAAWGTGNTLALELVNLMPSAYDDPQVPAPAVEHVDYRPHVHRLEVTREAVDAITACHQRIQALGDYFGWESTYYLDAARSWLHLLGGLFTMSLGAQTRVTRDGPLSLYVATGGGLVYGIIFHPTTRRCTEAGCPATIADDGTADDRGQPAHQRPHQPAYPLDAPQPGQWTFHS